MSNPTACARAAAGIASSRGVTAPTVTATHRRQREQLFLRQCQQRRKLKKGLLTWTVSGHAIANGRGEGVTKLLFDDSPEAHVHGKILGGDMIGEIALAIEMGTDALDIGKTTHTPYAG